MELEAVPEAHRLESGKESKSVPRSNTPPPALDDEHGAVQKDQVGRQEAPVFPCFQGCHVHCETACVLVSDTPQ